jgi:hypothetical protein
MDNNHAGENNNIDWCAIAHDFLPDSPSCAVYRIREDTTDFHRIHHGDVVVLDGVGYLIKGTESEKKFGMEGERKPWVKSCVDLVSGERKVMKLPFHEEFACSIEGGKFTCLRNPEKEARILDKTRGRPGFMQGVCVIDPAGGNVRILDRIAGNSLDIVVRGLPGDHRRYYENHLSGILRGVVSAVRSLAHLHSLGEIHGDITPDHIFREIKTGHYIWIDFDYDYKDFHDVFHRDILEMGALLAFVVGKEYVAYWDLEARHPEIAERITHEDTLLVLRNQIANLKLVYPYIDDGLNDILLRFSHGSENRYGSAAELADDLEKAIERL